MKEIKLQGINISLSEPLQVTEGVGYCWFPGLAKFPTGELLLVHSLAGDSSANLINAQTVFISQDKANTWQPRFDVTKSPAICIPQSDGGIAGPPFHLYPNPPGQMRNFIGPFTRFEAGGKYIMEPRGSCVLGLPHDVKPSRNEGKYSMTWMAEIYCCGDAVKLDNQFISTAYVRYQSQSRYSCVAIISEDEGRTWRYLSTIADPSALPPEDKDGPSESSMLQLDNGDLMCVMRVGEGSHSPLIRSYSSDGGKSWSPVDRLPAFSVAPSLVRLNNGVLSLSTGRPGLYLWLCTDTRGEKWQKVDILEHHNAWAAGPTDAIQSDQTNTIPSEQTRTTAYTKIVEIEPDTIIFVYDRIPFGWKPTPLDSEERSRIYVLRIQVKRS